MKHFLLFILISFVCSKAESQVWLSGRVYDSTRMIAIPAVKVSTKKGEITFTDSIGRYAISVDNTDTIFFTYRGKSTTFFAVHDIHYPSGFDISLQVRVQDRYQTLKEIVVIGKSYGQDSVENRDKYSKIFGFDKAGLKISETGGMGGTPGLDINSLIESFRFRRNKSMKSLQNRLISEEQEKFVNHKFSKQLVQKITGLSGRDLEKFMIVYRPTYEFTAISEEYEFHKYIFDAFKYFKEGVMPQMKITVK